MRRLVAIVFALTLVGSFVMYPSDAAAYARCNCTAWAASKRRDLPRPWVTLTLGAYVPQIRDFQWMENHE